jgi:hypothetical protein
MVRAMSRFEIWSGTTLIGDSDLESHDDGMNVRVGCFRPRPGYSGVRSVFKLYSAAVDLTGEAAKSALAHYFEMRDQLGLTVREPGGAELPAGSVHINDLAEAMDELEIEVYPPMLLPDG